MITPSDTGADMRAPVATERIERPQPAFTGRDIVEQAKLWLGTPFRHGAGVKGQGVDCGHFVLRVLQAVGGVPPDRAPGAYPPGWYLHRGDARFQPWLAEFCVPVDVPAPGDLVFFRVGRARLAHAGIVVAWPLILHADYDEAVRYDSAIAGELGQRLVGVWRLRAFVAEAAA
jgi:NlpC/P60 family putative phage cell wall peptidase